jgi:hypothetical protein
MSCKIICNDKEVANIECSKDGLNIKCTEEGKELCKNMCGEDSKECCK